MRFLPYLVVALLMAASTSANAEAQLKPSSDGRPYMIFNSFQVPPELFLSFRAKSTGNLESIREILPIKDRNPIRLRRVEDEMLSKVKELVDLNEESKIYLGLPWATIKVHGDYDRAGNSFNFLLPGALSYKYTDTGEKGHIDVQYPEPLTFGAFNSNSICCGNEDFSNATKSDNLLLHQSSYQIVRIFLDSLERAELIYDLSASGRLLAQAICEPVFVGKIYEGKVIGKHGKFACPLTFLSIGETSGSGEVLSIGYIEWQNGKYVTNYY